MSQSKLRYTIRQPTFDDLHAVVELVNACSIAEGGSLMKRLRTCAPAGPRLASR